MPKFVNLLPELVEKGHIKKRQVAILENYEIGTLIIGAVSKIKRHQHKEEWEVYIEIPTGRVIGVCDIGESHELENNTFNSMYVLYIKGKNGVQKFEQPSPEVVENEHFKKRKIAVLENYEIGIITLNPFSKIEKHKHENEWEIYAETPWGRVLSVCHVGESHGLENNTHHSLDVLYIKGKNGVPIPDDEDIKNFVV